MHLLLLTPCYPPDTAAYTHLIENLSADLQSAGHRVTVISSTTYGKPGFLRGNLWRVEENSGIRVLRINTFPSSRRGLVRKAAGFLLFTLLSFILGLTVGRVDLVFAASTPPTMGLVGGLLAKVRRVPFVYNVQDIFPDVVIKLGILRSPFLTACAFKLERWSYLLSAKIVVIGETFAVTLGAKGVPEEKLAVIPNWIDTAQLAPPERASNHFLIENGLVDKFVVLYAGNFGHSQRLETLVEAAFRLQDISHLKFVLVGTGERRAAIEEAVQSMASGNIILMPFQPAERLNEVFGGADVGVVPLRRGLAADSIPSKTWTMMAAGLPVLASIDEESALSVFVKEHGFGLCVEPESPQALADAIRWAVANRAALAEMGYRARYYTEEHISRKRLTGRYVSLFEGLARSAK